MKTKSSKEAPISSQIREVLAEKREIAARLPAEIAQATKEHEEAKDTFDRERGLAALDRKRQATTDLEKVQSEIADLETELAATEIREADDARCKRYDDAKAQAEAARNTFVKRYPELAGEITSMLRDVANADLAIAAVNEDLPEGGTTLRTVSNEIFSSYEPRLDLEDEEFEQWIHRSHGHAPESALPLDPSLERYIQDEGGRHFVRRADGLDFEVIRVKLVRRKFLPAVNHHGDGFARQLHLPALAHGQPFFKPAHGEGAEHILSALRAVENRMELVEAGRKPHIQILTLEQARREPLKRAA